MCIKYVTQNNIWFVKKILILDIFIFYLYIIF